MEYNNFLYYVFCSAHFRVLNMKKLHHNGSGHFPMFSHFKYQESLQDRQQQPTAGGEELDEAKKKASQTV